jgi:c-di-GMP-binding flagellar brake protein YcgR
LTDQEPRWGVASLQRRRHPRLDVSLPVEIVVRAEDPAEGALPGPVRASLRNVSGGGLLLVAPGSLAVGARIALTLYLPEGPAAGRREPRAVRAEAVVVWTDLATEGLPDETRCGVAFRVIADDDRAAIVDFVNRGRKG